MNPQELALLADALAFAADRHRNHRRKDSEASPYINHPIALMHRLVHVGGITDVHVFAAALLHDTIEDTETTAEELEERFGAVVRGVVEEVTDDKRLPREERKRLQVEHAAQSSPQAKLVKLADKICNLTDILQSPPDWDRQRKQEYFDWARQVVDALRGVHPGLEAAFDALHARRAELPDGRPGQTAGLQAEK